MAEKKPEKPFGYGALVAAAFAGYIVGNSGDDPAPTPQFSAEASMDYSAEADIEAAIADAEADMEAMEDAGEMAEIQPLMQSIEPEPEPESVYVAPEPVFVAPTYFQNCSAARAAGAAPVRRGSAGYGPHLDRDNDGVGCE